MKKLKFYLEVVVYICVVGMIAYFSPDLLRVFEHAFNEERYVAIIIGLFVILFALFGLYDGLNEELQVVTWAILGIGFICLIVWGGSTLFDTVSLDKKVDFLTAAVIIGGLVMHNMSEEIKRMKAIINRERKEK